MPLFFISFIACRNYLSQASLAQVINVIQRESFADYIKTDLIMNGNEKEYQLNFNEKLDISEELKYLSPILLERPLETPIRIEFGWNKLSKSFQFDYTVYTSGGCGIDFYLPLETISSLNLSNWTDEIDKINEFDSYFSCIKNIILLIDPLLVLGETEDSEIENNYFDIDKINFELSGIPKPGRITFLGREILSNILYNNENRSNWQEALKDCVSHESICNGGELMFLSPNSDLSNHKLILFLDKIRLTK